jgi:trypsin-like peptidase
MRKALLSVLLALTMLVPVSTMAGSAKQAIPLTDEQFREEVSHSTLAVYAGEQKCAWSKETIFIFQFDAWKCAFEEHFTCTATVIGHDDGESIALTAGHCFDWANEKKYYVAESTVGKPVLHRVKLLKFENDERYDYAIISFSSIRQYAAIPIEKSTASDEVVGTPVMNVNFSYGIAKEFSEGKVVSEIMQGDAGGQCETCKGRYLVSIGLGPGASGSAVIDLKTREIVGMVEATFPNTQMPTVVIPMGKNFVDFFEDDSAGLKPLPRGPKPIEKADVADAPVKFKFSKIVFSFLLYLIFGV